MSMSKELEKLKDTRVKLEEESRSLQEQQKNFEETVSVLEEKIAIEEQKHRNKETQDAISQLESKIKELEQRLKQTSKDAESGPEPIAKIEPEVNIVPEPEEPTAESFESKPEGEPDYGSVTVAPLPEPMAIGNQENAENQDRQREKKRRRLF
jgi:predicted  nucleic acid-binding Zn-ribbon protein